MAGTLEYLRWRGDLSFKERPFNSVDVSLFASIIYLPVDKSFICTFISGTNERFSW